MTPEGEPGEPDLDWLVLSRPNHTVVVYMGLTTAASLAARLVAAGRAASTPVLIALNASRSDERRLLTKLGDLQQATAGLDGPALLVIGEVAALADVEPLIASVSTTERRLA
jgi:uroporphyrin-III C-methyltransferase